jgi:signal transduction histidine kinase
LITGTRKSGLPAMGPIEWGTHLCHFYESRSELLSVTAQFLHAGVENGEMGVWVAPALLGPDKARYMLVRQTPALASFIDAGRLRILDAAELYAPAKTGFDGCATVGIWSATINEALGRGFEGLRVAGDAICNETTDWAALIDYEASLQQKLAGRPIIGLCTYCMHQLRAAQARDIERLHDATVQPAGTVNAWRSRASNPCRHAPEAQAAVADDAASDELKDRFTGPMIGHEIRNAITPLGLLARLLNTQYGHDEQLKRYALLLSRQASLLGELAQQLMAPAALPLAAARELALAAASTSASSPPAPLSAASGASPAGGVDIKDLLAHCAQVAEAGQPGHVPIELMAVDSPLSVQGEFDKLAQVFVNLMSNALKYSGPADTIQVSACRAGRYCYISVSDNGIGIAADDLATIFRPFTRGHTSRDAKVGGLGLGLSVVREIVASQGGTAEAFSDGPGRGSKFVVRLPLAAVVAGGTSPLRAAAISATAGQDAVV